MPSMTPMALIETPPPAKPADPRPKLRRYALVRIPPKYEYLRQGHD